MKQLYLAIVLAIALCAAGCKNEIKEEEMKEEPVSTVVLETSLGTMKIELSNLTPEHRDNFIKLAKTGFYDNTCFHRIINGFMIQGGDPFSRDTTKRDQWGTGGPGYTIPAEIDSTLHHCKGAVAAARLGDMANPRRASSGSQFYIVQDSLGCRHLDGQYTVFGQVVEGMEVIDKIAVSDTDPYDRPIVPVTITKAYVVEPVIEEPADSTAVTDSTAAPDSIKATK